MSLSLMQLASPKGYAVLKEEENKPVEKKRKLQLVSEARYSLTVVWMGKGGKEESWRELWEERAAELVT